jgi:hypothetical protein
MKDADWVRVLGDRREGIGVLVGVKTRVLGIPLFIEKLELTEWEPPYRLVMSHRSFVRGTGEWVLSDDGHAGRSRAGSSTGSRFRWTEELSLPIPLVGEIALLFYRPFMRHLMKGSLAGLQSSLRNDST